MVYIMSDIHGRKDRFDDVLKQVMLSENEMLCILGDELRAENRCLFYMSIGKLFL